MAEPRKFYRTVIRYEVLSEDEPVDGLSLEDIHHSCTTGDCSGMFLDSEVQLLDGPAVAKALLTQGSDPEFFGLDENGNGLEDKDEDEPKTEECENVVDDKTCIERDIANPCNACVKRQRLQQGYCSQCSDPEHDSCSMTAGCPCCDQTFSQVTT